MSTQSAEPSKPVTFLILLQDQDDAEGLATLLTDLLLPDATPARARCVVPEQRGPRYFDQRPEADSATGSDTVRIVEHFLALPSYIRSLDGQFVVGCANLADERWYAEFPAGQVSAVYPAKPLDLAATILKLFSERPDPLFDAAEADRLASLARDYPIEVEPVEWPQARSYLPGPADTLASEIAAAAIPEPYKTELVAQADEIRDGLTDSTSTRMEKRLRFIASLPWGKRCGGEIDIKRVTEALDADHYGMTAAKDAIIEYVAVLRRRSRLGLSTVGDAPKLCLVGPPGVGKTTLVRSIARGLGRENALASIAFGGFADAESLRGWDRAYMGTGPGLIMKAVRAAKCMDGILRLDEIEKAGRSDRGNPQDVLLELLDPEQNSRFTDRFLDIPFDLSEVIFIATANDVAQLDPALRDRLEIIKLRGYTAAEKLEIARRHIVPLLLGSHGLTPDCFSLADEVLPYLVEVSADEPGLRTMQRLLTRIMRKAVRILEMGEAPVVNVGIEQARLWTSDQISQRHIGFAVRSART